MASVIRITPEQVRSAAVKIGKKTSENYQFS